MAEKDSLNSPNLYADSRDDIAELYRSGKNDSRDYGSRPSITPPDLEVDPIPGPRTAEQLDLLREHPDAMKDAMSKAREMGERAAQQLPLFPEGIPRDRMYKNYWGHQARDSKEK